MNAGRLFVKVVFILVCLVLLIGRAQAQDVQPDPCPVMPEGFLCVPRAVAVKALEDADARKAQEVEIRELREKVIPALKDALADSRLEFVRASAEATALKQSAVSDRAIIELLLKYAKKKCLPFSVCF